GDQGVVVHGALDPSAGRAEAVFVAVRVGRLQQEIFMIGPRGSVNVEDATALAARGAPRMEARAGSQFKSWPGPVADQAVSPTTIVSRGVKSASSTARSARKPEAS